MTAKKQNLSEEAGAVVRPSEHEIREAIRKLRAIAARIAACHDGTITSAVAAGVASDALAWALGEASMELDGEQAPSFKDFIAAISAVR